MTPILPSPLVVQFAMRGEAAPLLTRGQFSPLRLQSPDDPYGFQLHTGKTQTGHTVLVAVAGVHPRDGVDSIGTLTSGILTHVLISRFQPRMIINAGTAGGFQSQGTQIGDVFLGGPHAVFHDRRVALPGNFPRFAEGHRPVLHDPELALRLGLKSGIVSTGDSLDCTPEDAKHLRRLNAAAKEMEAAAIAHVCERHGIPLVLLKSITDIVDHDHGEDPEASTESQFLRNYTLAVERLTDRLEKVIEHYSVG